MQLLSQAKAVSAPSFKPVQSGLLQRKCACGGSSGLDGQCKECREKRLSRKSDSISQTESKSVPPIVHEVLHSHGQPLDPATRDFMEPRFGHDFSKVRVHTDEKAANSALAVNALAYTVGRDVVFGLGQYAPRTERGHRLLTHELTHIVQQGGGVPSNRLQLDLMVGNETALYEHEADRMGDNAAWDNGDVYNRIRILPTQQRAGVRAVQRQVAVGAEKDEERFVEDAIQFLESSAEAHRVDLLSKEVRFDEAKFQLQLIRWKEMLEKSQGIIDSTLDKDATLSQNIRSAYQNAVTAAVAFAVNKLNQTSHTIYEKYREQIAEWALPQAVPEPIAGKLSEALPETERRKLTVITSPVSFEVDTFRDWFSTKGGTTTISLPKGVTVRFASAVPENLKHGLKNVASIIVPKPLELNSTMTLSLDLEPYGGNYSAYRFTYVEHKPQKGKPMQEILIEGLGALGIEGLTKSQAIAAEKKFDVHGFKRGSGWSNPEFKNVLTAISQISDSILSPVDGITFNRDQVFANDPKAGGSYNPDTHTITIFDPAFTVSPTRFGTVGVGISTDTVRDIAHEIGHAVDLLPLRQAWNSMKQKEQAQKTKFGQYENPPGSGKYSFPSTEQANFNKLKHDIAVAERAVKATWSESGEHYIEGRGGVFDMVEGGDRRWFDRIPEGGRERQQQKNYGVLQQRVARALRRVVFALYHGPRDAPTIAAQRLFVL